MTLHRNWRTSEVENSSVELEDRSVVRDCSMKTSESESAGVGGGYEEEYIERVDREGQAERSSLGMVKSEVEMSVGVDTNRRLEKEGIKQGDGQGGGRDSVTQY